MIMIRPLELSRRVLLMCALLWVKAGKSEVLVPATASSWSQECGWNPHDIFRLSLSELGGAPPCLEKL